MWLSDIIAFFTLSIAKFLMKLYVSLEPQNVSMEGISRRTERPHRLRCGSAAFRLLRLCFRTSPGHGYLSFVSVVGPQVEVSALDFPSSRESLPSVVCVSVVIKPRQWGGNGPVGAGAQGRKGVPRLRDLNYVTKEAQPASETYCFVIN